MGCVSTITDNSFPAQGPYVGTKVEVRFHYGRQVHKGTVVREDAETPFVTIFQLADGRLIRSTECQYRLVRSEDRE